MLLREDTYSLFRDLLTYCRDDEAELPNGVSEDRAPTYRRLVKNIIFGNLEKAYPLTKLAIGEEAWKILISDFFKNWTIPSPELWKMPFSLLEYVRHSDCLDKIDAPFLENLLLFEWSEIEVFMMPDVKYGKLKANGDVMKDPLQLNLESVLLKLSYSVHKVGSGNMDFAPGDFYVLCYRHPDTFSVHYLELPPATALIVEWLREEPRTGNELSVIFEENCSQCHNLTLAATSFRNVLNDLLLSKAVVGFVE